MRRAALMLIAVALVAFTSQTANAEQPGNVPQDALAAMGLADVQVMSDEEGQDIRGQGAFAFSLSYVRFFGNVSIGVAGASGRRGASARSNARIGFSSASSSASARAW